jgi:hypothetical protein
MTWITEAAPKPPNAIENARMVRELRAADDAVVESVHGLNEWRYRRALTVVVMLDNGMSVRDIVESTRMRNEEVGGNECGK